MATLLKVLNNLADIKSAGGVALRVGTQALRRIYVVKLEGEIKVSPFAKIQAISDIYFPQFKGAVEELDTAAKALRAWMYEVAQHKPKDEAELIAGHSKVITPYMAHESPHFPGLENA